jgi:macrodomain Ter protein organizer (MatP/YcbG family)
MLAPQPENMADLAKAHCNPFIAIRVEQAAGCRRKKAAGL